MSDTVCRCREIDRTWSPYSAGHLRECPVYKKYFPDPSPQSRSVQRRIAAKKGEPAPTFKPGSNEAEPPARAENGENKFRECARAIARGSVTDNPESTEAWIYSMFHSFGLIASRHSGAERTDRVGLSAPSLQEGIYENEKAPRHHQQHGIELPIPVRSVRQGVSPDANETNVQGGGENPPKCVTGEAKPPHNSPSGEPRAKCPKCGSGNLESKWVGQHEHQHFYVNCLDCREYRVISEHTHFAAFFPPSHVGQPARVEELPGAEILARAYYDLEFGEAAQIVGGTAGLKPWEDLDSFERGRRVNNADRFLMAVASLRGVQEKRG